MANLTFRLDSAEGVWYSEFTVTDDYNIHIELPEEATRKMRVLQKGQANERYALALSYEPSKPIPESEVVDLDFSHGVYPKMIRIEVFNQPIKASYTLSE